MPRYIALLRGVNVGKANRVTMAEWRTLLEGLGCTQVATLLNSGNAVFSAAGTSEARHAARIAEAMAAQMKVSVPVVVKSARRLAAIVEGNPFVAQAADPARLLVAFAPDAEALAGLRPIEALVTPPEVFQVGEHAAYLHCPGGILDSRAGKALLGPAGRAVTTRNGATTLKLLALVQG